ncbi:aminotransferase class V-fold PLP-dependent enzyme (plasmid) [Streptomyces sp. BI20]|uniref:aminotransferase class V-fold PLP-dependent enzyme n=1 Tax=Streptomyces sp. BI20 TaxID=3403460 RepID=UPI003C7805C1
MHATTRTEPVRTTTSRTTAPSPARAASRRGFLTAAGAGAAVVGLGGLGLAGAGTAAAASAPARAAGARWPGLEFTLDPALLHMNVGTVGSPPVRALDAVDTELRRIARDAVSGYGEFTDLRRQIAPGFGCDPDELALADNTTDGLCKILAGLDWRPGDEIVTTDHEHSGGESPLRVLRDRYGVVLRRVAVPVGNAQRAEDYVRLFAEQINTRTRALFFSAPTFTTGTMLPIRRLAALAQRHELISIVDGAHLPGMMAYEYRTLGVDFLAGAGAKWQCGPSGNGVLYVRNKVDPRYNPKPLPTFWTPVSMQYPEQGLKPRTDGAKESYDIGGLLSGIGNRQLANFEGFRTVCAAWDAIGRRRIEEYVLRLSARLKEGIAERWGVRALYSPKDDPELVSALSSFDPHAASGRITDEGASKEFVSRMRADHAIVVRATSCAVPGSEERHHPIRVSTHLFHEEADVDRVLDAMWRVSRAMA